MAKDTYTIGGRTLQAGQIILGPFTLVQTRQQLWISLDVTQHLNPGVLLDVSAEISFDGGATWVFMTSTGRTGGPAFEDGGTVSNTMTITLDFPPEQGNRRRQIRSVLTLDNGSLVTAGGTIEFRDPE